MKHSYSVWCSTLCAARLLALAPLDIAAQAPMAAPPGWEWRPVDPASGPLRVLLIYDMEGLSGIDRLAMTRCSFPQEYAAGQDRLVADVNAVIEGVAAAGVATIDVIDRHGSGCDETPDLPAARLDRRARYVDERARALFPRIMQHEWDAVALVGGHASPGHQGFLEHVGSFGIERVINGVSVCESEQQALGFGSKGIPITFASGDDRYAAQLRERMPWVTFVEVKRATSRTSAELRPPAEVRAALVAQVKIAVARRDRAKSMALLPPFTGAYRPVWPNALELLAAIPGVDISSGEIRVSGATPRAVNDAINRIATLVNGISIAEAHREAVSREGEKRDRFRDSLFMARWSVGPPTQKRPPR